MTAYIELAELNVLIEVPEMDLHALADEVERVATSTHSTRKFSDPEYGVLVVDFGKIAALRIIEQRRVGVELNGIYRARASTFTS